MRMSINNTDSQGQAWEMDKSLLESMLREHYRPDRTEHAIVPEQGAGTREFTSRDLLGGSREIIIRHGLEAYRLQLTNSGKLLLTK